MKNKYRVRLEWLDGHVTYTIPVGTLREAKRMKRAFAEVGLMRAVWLEGRVGAGNWIDWT